MLVHINLFGPILSDTFDNWEKRSKIIEKEFITNTNIKEAIKHNYETWFDCKNYYLVDQWVFEKD